VAFGQTGRGDRPGLPAEARRRRDLRRLAGQRLRQRVVVLVLARILEPDQLVRAGRAVRRTPGDRDLHVRVVGGGRGDLRLQEGVPVGGPPVRLEELQSVRTGGGYLALRHPAGAVRLALDDLGGHGAGVGERGQLRPVDHQIGEDRAVRRGLRPGGDVGALRDQPLERGLVGKAETDESVLGVAEPDRVCDGGARLGWYERDGEKDGGQGGHPASPR
jgi:hypothetical protein